MPSNDDAFREELRSWLAAHQPPDVVGFPTTSEDVKRLRDWQRTLHAGGWVGIHWPVEYGGRGASPSQVAIYNEELARAHAPDLLGGVGLSLLGPALMVYGTDEQQARWMRRILNAEDIWCQLFSEPGAGSDLAGLSTRAERHGDVYVGPEGLVDRRPIHRLGHRSGAHRSGRSQEQGHLHARHLHDSRGC
jgi:alkylation response protein AidB-like acyl-CoA dehydrogenase